MSVVPLSDEALTPRFILSDRLNEADNIQSIAMVWLDKDGFAHTSWSCPTQKDLAMLFVKFQAQINEMALE